MDFHYLQLHCCSSSNPALMSHCCFCCPSSHCCYAQCPAAAAAHLLIQHHHHQAVTATEAPSSPSRRGLPRRHPYCHSPHSLCSSCTTDYCVVVSSTTKPMLLHHHIQTCTNTKCCRWRHHHHIAAGRPIVVVALMIAIQKPSTRYVQKRPNGSQCRRWGWTTINRRPRRGGIWGAKCGEHVGEVRAGRGHHGFRHDLLSDLGGRRPWRRKGGRRRRRSGGAPVLTAGTAGGDVAEGAALGPVAAAFLAEVAGLRHAVVVVAAELGVGRGAPWAFDPLVWMRPWLPLHRRPRLVRRRRLLSWLGVARHHFIWDDAPAAISLFGEKDT